MPRLWEMGDIVALVDAEEAKIDRKRGLIGDVRYAPIAIKFHGAAKRCGGSNGHHQRNLG